MIKVIFEKPDGERVEVEAQPGQSLMRAAVERGIAGIVAECGGSAACGTCHVYVVDSGGAAFAEPSAQEAEMLGFTAAARQANSRLACQLIPPEGAGPIVVRIAPIQP